MNGLKNCNDMHPIQRLINGNSPNEIWTERCQKALDRLLEAQKVLDQLEELKESGNILDTRIIKLLETYNTEIEKINSRKNEKEQADITGC